MTSFTDAFAFSYTQEGHTFYVLTFPTDNRTFVYDMTTGLWHERASLDTGSQVRWRANCYAFFNNKHYVGDYNSGKIYQLDTETYTENSAVITRTRVTPLLVEQMNKRLTLGRLQIDFETAVGSSTTVTLELSTDGGNTYGTDLTRTISSSSTDYNKRSLWNRLGSYRNVTFKLTTSSTNRIVVLGAEADIIVGSD